MTQITFRRRAQSLFSASMQAQAAQTLWGRAPDKAKERLDRVAELCGGFPVPGIEG